MAYIQYANSEYTLSYLRLILLTFMLTAAFLWAHHQRQLALNPAVNEARLAALQARIRPHFLFNCINAVLSILRREPKRAEEALMDMADLFRIHMAEHRNLVSLGDEIQLARQYLALEKLRLGERLNVDWQIENAPLDAAIPPLILQPLLENAVYHGIEPLMAGGIINIKMHLNGRAIHCQMANPYAANMDTHNGHKIALANIRERLHLHFDAEANVTQKISNTQYIVSIVIPYEKITTNMKARVL